MTVGKAVLERHVLALGKAGLFQPLVQGRESFALCIPRLTVEDTDHRDPSRLRRGLEWPGDDGDAEKCNVLASPHRQSSPTEIDNSKSNRCTRPALRCATSPGPSAIIIVAHVTRRPNGHIDRPRRANASQRQVDREVSCSMFWVQTGYIGNTSDREHG